MKSYTIHINSPFKSGFTEKKSGHIHTYSSCAGWSFGVSFHFCFISDGMWVTNNNPCILFIQGNVVRYFPEVKSKATDELFVREDAQCVAKRIKNK